MAYTVEHGGFYRGVVVHILEDDVLANLQVMVKLPVAQVVATETAASAETVGGLRGRCLYSSAHSGHIRHLKTVGHVACKRHVENGGSDAFILHNVNNLCYKRACLPAEGTAGFKYHVQPRIAAVEVAQQTYKQRYVIIGASHKVAAAKVYPFQLWEPW